MTTPITDVNGGLRLSAACDLILEKVADAAANNLYDIPAYRYATTGQAVYDCEQVSVAIQRVQTGLSGIPGGDFIEGGFGCQFGWTLVAELAIVRCGPKVSAKGTVSQEATKAALDSSSQDTFILMEAMENLAQELIGSLRCALIPQAPNGAYVGTTAQLTLSLP